VRGQFPLGGFPIPGIALSQVGGPLAPAAELGGPLLVVALTAVAGTAIAGVVLARRPVLVVTGAAVLIVAVLLGTAPRFTEPAGRIQVAVVQGGGERGIPAVFTDPQDVTERHFAVSARIDGQPDLVLWPEGVASVEPPLITSRDGRRLSRLAQRLDATVVAGVTLPVGTQRFRNLAVAWGPDGRLLDFYDKVHRVPFGEYIPARELFELITDATALVPRDAIPGEGRGLLQTPAGDLGVVISYEVFFSERARAAVRAGGQVLLVPTNAASYTGNVVPTTEVAAARMRALETDRAVLQAAPTGYSAIVLPDGQVIAQSRLEAPALLTGSMPLRNGLTPYARLGDWPMLALALLTLASPLAIRRRQLRR
jgi:apolipoprotein N-acyltransferase